MRWDWKMNRRSFFKNSTTAILAAFIPVKVLAKEAKVFEITRTKREWKALLSDLEYKVMRNTWYRAGLYFTS